MFQLITNPDFRAPKDFVRVIRDPRDASKDVKMLRERAEACFKAGIFDYDIADGTYCSLIEKELRP